MMKYCCMCQAEESAANSNLIFHRIPKDPETRTQWLQILGKKNANTIVVCSKHFQPEDYRDFCQRPLLKKGAVPRLNICNINTISGNDETSEEDSAIQMQCERMSEEYINENLNKENTSENANKETRNENLNVHENPNYESIPNLKRKSNSIEDESSVPMKKQRLFFKNIGSFRKEDFRNENSWQKYLLSVEVLRKEKLHLLRKNKRLVSKINTFKDIIQDLKEKRLLSDSVADILNKICSPIVRQLVKTLLYKKQKAFPNELKEFACTLHFYSPAAYEYVRKTFLNILPHQSTIRKWLSSSDNQPGISTVAMQYLKDLCENAEAEQKKLYFSLTCDEMAIRKHVEFDGRKWHGFVDIGSGSNFCDNDIEATNALVFMLVGINRYVKIVVAYYLIHSLSGDEKSNILIDILQVAHTYNIEICNITFDGVSTNINMVKNLGAKITSSVNKLKVYIEHPTTNEPITVMLDACHMLKLVRNTLAAKGSITDKNGNLIEWKFFSLLVEKQEKEELHLATKIRRRHIAFQNEKMKVRLAAQTFSSSVAVALKTCEVDFKLSTFQGTTPTAEFCQIINNIFDALNSRNCLNKKPTQQPISVKNLDDFKVRAEEYIKYIEGLKILDKPILQTKNKTGFLGLIICLKSVIFLSETLFSKKYLTYLLTYKMSQDHLETFFSCIRRFGGYNNNPTVRQFISALKKLHTHVNMNIVFNGNCTPQDDTVILQLNDVKSNHDKDTDTTDVFIWNVEHDYAVQQSMSFTEYQTDILKYIAGFVASAIKKKLNCYSCIQSLEQEETPSQLQKRKEYGRLFKTSNDVIIICKTAENVFRKNARILVSDNVVKKLILLTLYDLQINELFTKLEHAFDQAPLMDHKNQVIRLLLEKFFILRLHHYATSRNVKTDRIRSKFTKLITHQNQ